MDQRSDDIRQDIEETRASLDTKLNLLEEKANETTEKVKQAFDIKQQVQERPWAALGVAVAAGYVLGSMGGGDEDYYDRRYSPRYEQRWQGQPMTTTDYSQHAGRDSGPSTTDKVAEKGKDFLSQFDDEIDMLKMAAMGALSTFLRDAVRQYVPSMSSHIDELMRQRGLTPGSSSSSSSGATYSGSSSSRYSPSAGAAAYSEPSSSSSSGRQISSSPTESFEERAQLPNADYDDIGQMNRVGMPPRNNPSDSEYYEVATPGTSSDRPEPPAATPAAMDEQAKRETRDYTQ